MFSTGVVPQNLYFGGKQLFVKAESFNQRKLTKQSQTKQNHIKDLAIKECVLGC